MKRYVKAFNSSSEFIADIENKIKKIWHNRFPGSICNTYYDEHESRIIIEAYLVDDLTGILDCHTNAYGNDNKHDIFSIIVDFELPWQIRDVEYSWEFEQLPDNFSLKFRFWDIRVKDGVYAPYVVPYADISFPEDYDYGKGYSLATTLSIWEEAVNLAYSEAVEWFKQDKIDTSSMPKEEMAKKLKI